MRAGNCLMPAMAWAWPASGNGSAAAVADEDAGLLLGWSGIKSASPQSLKMYRFPARTRQTWLQLHCLGPLLAATLKPGWSDGEHGREGRGARQESRIGPVPEWAGAW